MGAGSWGGAPSAPQSRRTCGAGGLLAELVDAERLCRGPSGSVQEQAELAALVEGAAQRRLPAGGVRGVPGPEPARLLRPRLPGGQRPAPPAPPATPPHPTPPHCPSWHPAAPVSCRPYRHCHPCHVPVVTPSLHFPRIPVASPRCPCRHLSHITPVPRPPCAHCPRPKSPLSLPPVSAVSP